ncbi:MAG: ATP synthase F0 subunit B [Desulfobacterales bacterium]|nr:ATP synthase F0 subunit B [Desulfobacterales bacterium]
MKKFSIKLLLLFIMAFVFFLGTQNAFASGKANDFRATYDLILKWLNFGILAFLIYKFLLPHIITFLNERKQLTLEELQVLEKEKNLANIQVQESQNKLDKSEEQLSAIMNMIIEEGERKKEEIIEEANITGKMMIENAKGKIANRIRQAKKSLRSDLVDKAIELSVERLPKEITKEDNNKFFDNYLNAIPR